MHEDMTGMDNQQIQLQVQHKLHVFHTANPDQAMQFRLNADGCTDGSKQYATLQLRYTMP